MNPLGKWFWKPISISTAIVELFFVDVLYAIVGIRLILLLFPVLPSNPGSEALISVAYMPLPEAIESLIKFAWLFTQEEFFYRLLPFVIAWIVALIADMFWMQRRIKYIQEWLMIAACVISSVLFGIAHGSAAFILLQGVQGVIVFVFFVRMAYTHRHHIIAAFIVVLAEHLIFDYLLVAMELAKRLTNGGL